MIDTVLTRIDSLNCILNASHPQPVIFHLSSDAVIAFCGVAIALCALSVSIYQSLLSRKQFLISSEPALKFIGYFHKGDENVGLLLENKGPGAAKILSFNVTLQGRTFPCTEQFEKEITTITGVSMKAGTLATGAVLKSEDKWWLLSVKSSDVTEAQLKQIDDLCCKQILFKIQCKTSMGKKLLFDSEKD
jgi:hypothetical protein